MVDLVNKGLVGRALPMADADNIPGDFRLSRYGDQTTIGIVRKQHGLSDEGAYFITNNASVSGVLSSGANTWVDTTPCLVIANTDSTGNTNAKRIYVDNINLVTTVVGSAASGLVNLQAARWVDLGNRSTSGGTD